MVLEVPWAGTILRELSGVETGRYRKTSPRSLFMYMDSDPFGILPSSWIEAHHVEPDLPADVVSWWIERDVYQCLTYAGREVMVLQLRGQLYGRLSALPAPVPSRCGGDDATVLIEIGEDTGVPASHARISYRERCEGTTGPPDGYIEVRDIRIHALGGAGARLNEPRIVELQLPERHCRALLTRSPETLSGTVRFDVPPSPGAPFNFEIETVPSDAFHDAAPTIHPGRTEGPAYATVPEGFVGRLDVVARSRPDAALPSSASASVEVLAPLDPACPLGSIFERVRFEPRWDGCWTCQFRLTRLRSPLVVNATRTVGQTMRLLNGVVSRNELGLVASVSESAGGVPTSFIMLEGALLHELSGIQLRDLNVSGHAVGTRVDPARQLRSAVVFDGRDVKEYGTLGGRSSEALALSDAGWFVGWAEDVGGAKRAFVAGEGGLEAIPLPPHLESEAVSIGGDRWVTGTLLTEKGQQGFLFDVETSKVHVAELPQEGAALTFTQVDAWGRALGMLSTPEGRPAPVLFSADAGLVRLDGALGYPPEFWPLEALGLTDDGSVFLAAMLDGVPTSFRFSP